MTQSQEHLPPSSRPPLIAITADLMVRKDKLTSYLATTYADAVTAAGGIPVLLPPILSGYTDIVDRFDGFIFAGGDDPKTEPFGVQSHPQITPVLEPRQHLESELIEELKTHPEVPVLGICLGMQMLALCHGGRLNQHLSDTHLSHAVHWRDEHPVQSTYPDVLSSGSVWSVHRQAVEDSGSLRVIATAPDGIIEAIDDPNRAYLLGVQWHPERTSSPELGQRIFGGFLDAARQHQMSKAIS